MEIGNNAREQLKSVVERIERLETEIKELQSDRGDIYKEAGSNGFDVPALKAIVRARREDTEKRQAREAQVELYRGVLGIE
jgi:uncharacterized protein (UPF0335 family)